MLKFTEFNEINEAIKKGDKHTLNSKEYDEYAKTTKATTGKTTIDYSKYKVKPVDPKKGLYSTEEVENGKKHEVVRHDSPNGTSFLLTGNYETI